MKVWIVFDFDLDSWDIIKIFDSEDKAKKFVDEHNATVKYYFEKWDYEDYEVE